MHKIGNYVLIKDGPNKDKIGKIIDIDTSATTPVFYIQLKEGVVIHSIAFYFKATKEAVNDEDYGDIDWNRATAINVIPPRVQDILNHEAIASDSSSESSDSSSDSEEPLDDRNGGNGSDDEIENEQEVVEEEGDAAEIQLPEQANDGEITCNTDRYGDIIWRPQAQVAQTISPDMYSLDTRLVWNHVTNNLQVNRSIWLYFLLMFPTEIVNTIVESTNKALEELLTNNRHLSGCGDLTRGEFYLYLGIRLVITLLRTHESIDLYWSTSRNDKSVLQGYNFGEKYGMSRQRFQNIERALRFGPSNEVILF
jgi:hypothetical protein